MGEFDFGPDHYQTVGTMQWNAFVSNVGGALLVTGSITGVVATECSRCLDEVEYDVNGELEAYLIIPGESEAPEDMDEDEFDYLPESNQLDFEPILRAPCWSICPMCRCVLKTARVCARNAARTSTTALAAASRRGRCRANRFRQAESIRRA